MMCNEPTIYRCLGLKIPEMRRNAVDYYEQRLGSDGAKFHWLTQMTYKYVVEVKPTTNLSAMRRKKT